MMADRKASRREYYERNKEKIREQSKKWQRKYYNTHREEIIKRRREWERAHPEKRHEYYLKHKEQIYQRNKERRERKRRELLEMSDEEFLNKIARPFFEEAEKGGD